MSDQTKELLKKVLAAVERCYQASNGFSDETRAQLLRGARGQVIQEKREVHDTVLSA